MKISARQRTRVVASISGLCAIVTAALLMTSCSPTPLPRPTSPATPTAALAHIHEVVVDANDGSLLIATHDGLYRVLVDDDDGIATGPLGSLDFDPMGFTIADGIAYASGHPGPTTPDTFGSPNLGLITSVDLTGWTNVSLTGAVDFHGLAVSPGQDRAPYVFGLDSASGAVQRSLDGGVTWADGPTLPAFDIIATGGRLYATTPDGLAVSDDTGASFTVDTSAPKLVLMTTDASGALAGIDTTGTIWFQALGEEWIHGRTVVGPVQAIALDGTRLYVATSDGVSYTDDAGETWAALHIELAE
jgi:hypothetical protein